MAPHGRAALAIWISRGISISCKLASLPLLLKSLKIDEYAALVTLVALESWFLLLDCGLGLSIQNFLSETFCPKEQKSLIKTTFVFGFLFLAIGALSVLSTYPLLSQFFLGNCAHLDSPHENFLLAASFLLLGVFGSLGGRILMAQQRGFFFYLIQSIAGIVSLVFLVVFQGQIHFRESIVLVLGIPSLASFLITLLLLKEVDWKAPLRFDVLKRAKQFGLFALMAACVLSSDALMVPKLLGPQEIAEYNVISKLFAPIAISYSAWLQAFWPTCAALWASNKGIEIARKIFNYSLIGIVATLVFTVGVFYMVGEIQTFLKISLPLSGILWGGLYVSVRIVADFHAMALQSRSELKPFFYLVPIQAAFSLLLQWYLSSLWGMTGILAGLTLSYLLTVCWALPFRLYKVKSRLYA